MNCLNVRVRGDDLTEGFLRGNINLQHKIYYPICFYVYDGDYKLNQKPKNIMVHPPTGIVNHLGLNRYQWLGTVRSIHCNDYYGALNVIVEVGDYRWIWKTGGRFQKPDALIPQVGKNYTFEGELFLDGLHFPTHHNRTGNYYHLPDHTSFAYSAMQLYDVTKIQQYQDVGCIKTGIQNKEMVLGEFVEETDDEPVTYTDRGDVCVHDYILTLAFLNKNGLEEYNRIAREHPDEQRFYIP